MKDRIDINSDAVSLRRQFGEDGYSPIDIFSMLGSADDLTVVFYPMSERISGACVRDNGNKLIAINSRLSYGRQRFTAAHELCHLFFHDQFKSVVCAKDIDNVKDPQEIEADIFASYFLAPYESLTDFIKNKLKKQKNFIELNDVVKIEQYYGLSRQAALWRLITDGYLSKDKAATMRKNVILSAQKLGFDTKLYSPTPTDKQYNTLGQYITLAEQLNERGLVSTGKYEELLLDAFRSDIVFGVDNEEDEHYD